MFCMYAEKKQTKEKPDVGRALVKPSRFLTKGSRNCQLTGRTISDIVMSVL